MKIAIVVRIRWPGGVQRLACAEANGLRRLGHDVDLIFIRKTSKYFYESCTPHRVLYDEKVKNRLPNHVLTLITHKYAPQRGDDATIDVDLILNTELKYLKDYNIVYYYDEFSALFSKYSKIRYGHKVVVIIHEVALESGPFLSRLAQKLALSNADIILTHSVYNLEILQRNGYKNSYEVFLGLDPKSNVPSFDERDDMAISVTMWDAGRKPEILVDIAKHMKRGKMVIAGSWADSNYMKSIIKLINSNGVSEMVKVTGPLSDQELNNYYRKAKVAIRFGYNEKGAGMGSLEAISWGIPMIINNGIGIREKVSAGINGYIVNEKEPERTAEIIEGLFTDKELWNTISSNNLKLANNLSWEQHNKELERILKNLVSKQ